MVGLVERIRKPKSPIVLGPLQTHDVIHQQVASRPQNVTSPVLRNFSYPTNITKGSSSYSTRAPPSTWDQLGEICNFSPNRTSPARRNRAAGLEDPFFYTTDRTPYKQLVDLDDEITTNYEARHSTDSVPLSVGPVKNVEEREPKDKGAKLSKNHSISDHIISPKSSITARLKRNSLGHHKASSSLDTSRLLTRQPGSVDRPISSSDAPLTYIGLTRSSSTVARTIVSPFSFPGDNIEGILADFEEPILTSDAQFGLHGVRMGSFDSQNSPRRPHQAEGLSGDQQNGHASETQKTKVKGKEGKARWISQFKEWVSVSEPSTQALRNYKKDTYKKAGIALDDPQASAKLHLPVASLPPGVIKPGGRGPEPEEIASRRATQRKRALKSLPMAGVSQESRSSASHYSSSSSATVDAVKRGE
ncbi:hypothetical protein GGR51DRAFT_560809 [Nemania sp. FL0031]|nr:hypothetical protein GGR51DRAFT_560809 [Nemania sp. FL0031]